MLFDSLGLDVWIVINNNAPIIGTHAGLYINTDGKVLYDPGGSYKQDTKGTGDTLYGADANLDDYTKFQREDGPDIEIFHFPLSPEQDKKLIDKIEKKPTVDIFWSSDSALQGQVEVSILG